MKHWQALVSGCVLTCSAAFAPATQAQPHAMDPLFVVGASRTGPDFKLWRVNSESAVALVRAQPDVNNQHPSTVSVAVLRQALAALQWDNPQGKRLALLRADEAEALAPLVVQAFAQARAAQDILILSTARREGGVLSVPNSVSMRVFVQGERLHVVVGEARSHALDAYRAVKTLPTFEFGSRTTPSSVKLYADGAQAVRSDWVSFALQGSVPAAVAPVAPALAPAPVTPAPAHPFEAQAAKLKGLLMLKEQGLITEAEYQSKRQAIVDAL